MKTTSVEPNIGAADVEELTFVEPEHHEASSLNWKSLTYLKRVMLPKKKKPSCSNGEGPRECGGFIVTRILRKWPFEMYCHRLP